MICLPWQFVLVLLKATGASHIDCAKSLLNFGFINVSENVFWGVVLSFNFLHLINFPFYLSYCHLVCEYLYSVCFFISCLNWHIPIPHLLEMSLFPSSPYSLSKTSDISRLSLLNSMPAYLNSLKASQISTALP